MLDSYQHHYFVSLVMVCMLGFPRLALRDAIDANAARSAAAARLTRGFGFPLLCATVSILYVFTSVAKMESQWCRGYTLQRLSHAHDVFAPLASWFRTLGVANDTFWSIMSISVIPVELAIALAYALATYLDDASRRWLRRYAALGFALAVSLHAGAEQLGLEIGLFSYYMFTLAAMCLLPPRAFEWLARGLARTWQALAGWVRKPQASEALAREPRPREAPNAFEAWLLTICCSGALAAVGFMLDLPGAFGALSLAALTLCLVVAIAHVRGRVADARRWALTVGFSGLAMWGAIAISEVRWDYYRYLGGDLQRRGETRAAIQAYLAGERYAPKGRSRRNRIRELQRQLGEP
jgi:hypothetical protein